MGTQLLFPYAPLDPPMPRLPVWPPMPLRAALTPPALPPSRRRGPRAPAVKPVFQVVYLVGCGKTKQSRRSRARELYTGNLFRACRAHAEANATSWRILSARYGAVRPNEMIEPYDARLPKRGGDVAAWAVRSATDLTSDPALAGGFRVVCLAGADYAGPICAVLRERGIECSEPMRGLGVGQRLRWLKENAR